MEDGMVLLGSCPALSYLASEGQQPEGRAHPENRLCSKYVKDEALHLLSKARLIPAQTCL